MKPIKLCLFLMLWVGLGMVLCLPQGYAYDFNCYQETANVTSYCYGLNTNPNGTYYLRNFTTSWYTDEHCINGNWTFPCYADTGLANIGILKVNYTIPINVLNSSSWEIGYTNGIVSDVYRYARANLSFPGECYNTTTNLLQLQINNYLDTNYQKLNASCWNGTQWELMAQYISSSSFYYYFTEEAINWNVSYGIDNCTNSFGVTSNATAFNFTWYDTGGTKIGLNVSALLYYGIGSHDIPFYFTNVMVPSYKYCIYPAWLNITGDLSMQYIYGTTVYSYNPTDLIFNNVTDYINFTIETTGTSGVTATVYDQTNQFVEECYIYVMRLNIATGNYDLVGIYATNFEGQTQIPITLYTQKYKFLLYYPSTTLVQETNPTYIYATTITFQISTAEDILDDYYTSEGVYSSLSFDNTTRKFTYTFSGADVEQGCMNVSKQSALGDTIYNTSCVSGISGTIVLGVINTSGTCYMSKSSVYLGGLLVPQDSLSYCFVDTEARDTMGMMAILVDAILTIALMFLVTFSIPLAILLVPVPTLILATTGFLAIDVNIAIAMEIAALVVAVIINRRG